MNNAIIPLPFKSSWKISLFDNNVIFIDNGPESITNFKRVFDAKKMVYCSLDCSNCENYHCKLEGF